MKILLIVLLIIIILYFVIIKRSSFGSLTTIYEYPSPLPGLPQAQISLLTWTTINTIPVDDNFVLKYVVDPKVPSFTFYRKNVDMSRSTDAPIAPNPVPPNQSDQTIVKYYLSCDTYASSFMENSEQNPVPNTIIDVSQYNIGTRALATKVTYKPVGVATASDYYTLSWDNVKNLTSVSLIPGSKVVLDANTVKKIKAGVLYSLINLYYNPGNVNYGGLVYDLSTNYPIGVTTSVTNTPNASTMGITFRPASKHAVWVYLLARAQWINTTIQGL